MLYARVELLFGLGRQDGGGVSKADWRGFLGDGGGAVVPRDDYDPRA